MAPIAGKPTIKVQSTAMKGRSTPMKVHNMRKKVPTPTKVPNPPLKVPNKPIKSTSMTVTNVQRKKSSTAYNKTTAEGNTEHSPAKSKSKLPMTPNKVVAPSSSQTIKKKSWQHRPKPPHSGVPMPEKLKKMLEKEFLDPNDIF